MFVMCGSDVPSTSSGITHPEGELMGPMPLPPEYAEEMEVERIIDKKLHVDGRVFYLLHWKHTDAIDDTWEPLDHLDCPELISDFEKKRTEEMEECKEKDISGETDKENAMKRSIEIRTEIIAKKPDKKFIKKIGRKRKSGGKFKVNRFSQLQLQSPFFISDCATGQEASDEEFSGFDRGLEAEKVVGVTEDEGNLMVYIRWKDSKRREFVSIEEASIHCPQLVISYFEKRLCWMRYDDHNIVRSTGENSGLFAKEIIPNS